MIMLELLHVEFQVQLLFYSVHFIKYHHIFFICQQLAGLKIKSCCFSYVLDLKCTYLFMTSFLDCR